MKVKRDHDGITNVDFENVAETGSLPNLTEYYGKIIEVEDGPEGGEIGVLIYVPHISAAELFADEDAS